jgi:hypothetical protein
MPIDEHEILFKEYLIELRIVFREVTKERENELQALTLELNGDAQQARASIFEKFGPTCAHGRVIATIRKYWLACDRLNKKHEDLYVPPRVFVFENLFGEEDELADFLSDLAYWPIGLDEAGNYV